MKWSYPDIHYLCRCDQLPLAFFPPVPRQKDVKIKKALFQLLHCEKDREQLRSAYDEQKEELECLEREHKEHSESKKKKEREKAQHEKNAATLERKTQQARDWLKKQDTNRIGLREQLERERKRVKNADDRITSYEEQKGERDRRIEQYQDELSALEQGAHLQDNVVRSDPCIPILSNHFSCGLCAEREDFEQHQAKRERARSRITLTDEQRQEYERLQIQASTAASTLEDVR
jgi:hypothetical protein